MYRKYTYFVLFYIRSMQINIIIKSNMNLHYYYNTN